MHEIGSEAWTADLDRRLARRSVEAGLTLVVQQRLTGAEPRSWHVIAADGRLRARPGEHEAPDIVLTTDVDTAAAILTGSRSPQREFLDGRLRIGGDIPALLAARAALAATT